MVMNSLAICYQEIGNDEKAEVLLRRIVARDSQSVSAKQNLENFLRKKDAAKFDLLLQDITEGDHQRCQIDLDQIGFRRGDIPR